MSSLPDINRNIWHYGRYQWCSTCKGIVKYPGYLTLTWLWPYHISAGINDTVHVKELWHVKITWHLLWPHDISVLKHVVCPVSLTILDFSGTTFPIGNVGFVPVVVADVVPIYSTKSMDILFKTTTSNAMAIQTTGDSFLPLFKATLILFSSKFKEKGLGTGSYPEEQYQLHHAIHHTDSQY